MLAISESQNGNPDLEVLCMDMRKTAWLQAVTCISLFLCAAPNAVWAQSRPAPIGAFENHGDVGTVLHPGSVKYDASKKTYIISGSGQNMWLKEDSFQFAWKKVPRVVPLTAARSILVNCPNPPSKPVSMILPHP